MQLTSPNSFFSFFISKPFLGDCVFIMTADLTYEFVTRPLRISAVGLREAAIGQSLTTFDSC